MARIRTTMLGVGAFALLGAVAMPVASAHSRPANAPKITLTVAEWTNPPAIQATKLMDQEFQRLHPNVHIQLIYAPTTGGAWGSMQRAQMAAHSVDVMAQFSISGNWPKPYMTGLQPSLLEQWINAGQITNMTNMPFVKKDFPAGEQMHLMGYKGKIWGVTMASYGRGGVFYNQSMFQRLHLTVPRTFSQLIHVCQVLKAHHITPFMVGAKDGWDQMITEGAIEQEIPHAQAANFVKGLWTGRTTFANDPVFRKILTRYKMLSQYFEPNAFGEPYAPTPGLFAGGKAAMLVDGSWDGYTIHQANPKLHFSWFPLPMTNTVAKNNMQVAGDFSWVVPSWAPAKKIALQYVQFVAQPNHYHQWEDIVGAIPTEPQTHLNALPWMSTELQFLPHKQFEFSIPHPQQLGPQGYVLGDTAYLKPQGPYTIPQLLSVATQQWLGAINK